MYRHKKKTTVSWTTIAPDGGTTMIYRGLYENGYRWFGLLVHTIVNEGFFVVVYLLFVDW